MTNFISSLSLSLSLCTWNMRKQRRDQENRRKCEEGRGRGKRSWEDGNKKIIWQVSFTLMIFGNFLHILSNIFWKEARLYFGNDMEKIHFHTYPPLLSHVQYLTVLCEKSIKKIWERRKIKNRLTARDFWYQPISHDCDRTLMPRWTMTREE